MKFPVGLQLYSVREELSKDFEGTLEKVSKLGFDGVEFAGLFDNSPEKVRELCEKYSLTPISAHVPYDGMLKDIDKVISDYKTIGCKYLVVSYMNEGNRPGDASYPETVKNIGEIGKKVSESGLTLLYHNHDFEFVKIDGEYGLDVLYSTLDSSVLQTELDTCWVRVGGEDPAGYIRKYSNRAPVVHLKDYDPGDGSKTNLYKLIGIDDSKAQSDEGKKGFSFRPVGYGVQNFEEILSACHDAGAKWVIIEQDEPSLGKTPLECAELSIKYLSSINK